MSRFEALIRRVDEALAEASAGVDASKIADLARQRSELERALLGRGGLARTVARS